MTKTRQRRMLILKNPGNPLIDEAYLILKDDPAIETACSGDILEEANRLIASRTLPVDEIRRHRRLPAFLWGVLAGGGLSFVLFFLFFW